MRKTVTLEMGLTPKMFADTLPAATQPYQIQSSPLHYVLHLEQLTAEIQLTPLADRVIASLSLPVTRVDIAFTGHTEEQVTAFMDRFMRYFHRGGG